MTASVTFLTVLVTIGLVVTAVAPVALLLMLLVEHKKGQLW